MSWVETKAALVLCAALLGCGTGPTCAAAVAAHDAEAARNLRGVFDRYWEENLRLRPQVALSIGDTRFLDRLDDSLTDDFAHAARRLATKYLEELGRIDPQALCERDLVSYEIFRYLREQELRFHESGLFALTRMLPVSQMGGVHAAFASDASGESVFPFRTPEDYEKNLLRAEHFARWVRDAIARMREGAASGIVQPRVLIDRMLPQLQAQLAGPVEDSLFYKPILNMPASFPVEARERLTAQYRSRIESVIRPAYAQLLRYIVDEYRPRARTSAGIGAVPGGERLYRFLIQAYANTDWSPQQIHELGLAEVERIMQEFGKVQQQVGFAGTLQEFFAANRSNPALYYRDRQEVLDGYQAARAGIDARLPQLFDVKPRADYVIKAVPQFMEESQPGARYNSPSADGSRPGIFWVNTHRPTQRERFVSITNSLHEASPGHHFQSTIAQELADLPAFRRFDESAAFGEGWALYAETLGYELRLYDDPWQRYGHLNGEAIRANRLVVDTGLHALGWTRERAIEWMIDHSTMSRGDAVAEVERYMAIPGQALAYKIGQLEISRLRSEAQRALGARFDVREFHRQILVGGSMPLPMLRSRMARWTAQSK